MNYFASNIRFLRVAKGLKQVELARKLGLPRTTWASYENRSSQPNIDGLVRIAAFFGIDLNDLICRSLEDNPVREERAESEEQFSQEGIDEHLGSLSRKELALMCKYKEEMIAALQEVINTQKKLIEALEINVSLLKSVKSGKKV